MRSLPQVFRPLDQLGPPAQAVLPVVEQETRGTTRRVFADVDKQEYLGNGYEREPRQARAGFPCNQEDHRGREQVKQKRNDA